MKALRAAGRGFGWAIAYFTLLPFWWKGQTLGKRVFGLRVVELTGKPLGLMNCFGRYGGYAAATATGGAGFAQVLWDPNRQAMQDKLAHTVVVDLRAPRGLAEAREQDQRPRRLPGLAARSADEPDRRQVEQRRLGVARSQLPRKLRLAGDGPRHRRG